MNKTYETNRLLLKMSHDSFADMVLDYCTRNKEFLGEWEPIREEAFYTKEFQKKQLLEDMDNKDLFRLWIFKKGQVDKIIGCLSFTNIMRGAFLSCFFGYKLDEQELNHGYMTEAIKKATQVVFDELGLHRIEANIMPKNKRSLRVASKAGFYKEGISYKYLKINGEWEDHIHMVLLKELQDKEPELKIEHIALYVRDLEQAKKFYVNYFKGQASEKYTNEIKGFSSYFICFSQNSRLELMSQADVDERSPKVHLGYAHIAMSVGTKEKVVSLTQQLREDGFEIVSEPRTTGDGYFESCILDQEGNRIEITV